MKNMFFDRDGDEQSFDWFVSHWDLGKRVAQTPSDDCFVSTVHLGINHRHWGDGPPLIFETMVFDDQKVPLFGGYSARYATEEEAIRGHVDMVDWVRRNAHQRIRMRDDTWSLFMWSIDWIDVAFEQAENRLRYGVSNPGGQGPELHPYQNWVRGLVP